jgi:hypothetical protein
MFLGGWMDGWMDGWIDGWMDGWMEAIKNASSCIMSHRFTMQIFLKKAL